MCVCEAFYDGSPGVSKNMGASFCIDLVSPHSHGAKIIYTVVSGYCRCACLSDSSAVLIASFATARKASAIA